MRKKFDTKDGVLMLFGVVVIALAIFYAVLSPGFSAGSLQSSAPLYAPSGTLAPGFPSELVVDQGAIIAQSYSIHYPPSTEQYATTFNSKMTGRGLFLLYQNYFAGNGWQVTHSGMNSGFSGIYAVKMNDTANIMIVPAATSTQVSVGYLVQ